MRDHMILDRRGTVARTIEVGKGVDGDRALGLCRSGGALDRDLQDRVRQRQIDAVAKGAHASSPIAGPSPMPAISSIA
jgi:hypothetical protein